MDVRGRRLRKQSDAAAAFTSSTSFDGRIARQVVAVNKAHVVALVQSGEIQRPVGSRILGFLLETAPEPKPATLSEDFHQQLEQEATDALGVKVAGYLNFGKSRNDQVATAIRMELRRALLDLALGLIELQSALLTVALRDGACLVPGYTHLQRAQPVTLAHYAFSHFDAHQRNLDRILQLYGRVNISPMGSAALGGTSVTVDRRAVAQMLGFDGVTTNAMDSVASRDLLIEALACATIVMVDASRLAEEQILWSSREFGLVELADEYSASSSIMPQKKNPVVAEVVRAKAGSVIGRLVSVCAILKALPFAYNLDLQEATPHLWEGLNDTIASIRLLGASLSSLKFNRERAAESVAEDYSTATALANYLVSDRSLSFREAHSVVGDLVRESIGSNAPLVETVVKGLPRASKRFGKVLDIDLETARSVLDPTSFVNAIRTEGGANPTFIKKEATARTKALEASKNKFVKIAASLKSSEKSLARVSRSIAKEVKIEK